MDVRTRHRRLAAVIGLTILGVTIAMAGSGFGVVGALSDDQPSGKVSIAGDNVTFETGNERVTLVENASKMKEIEVSATDGRIAVTTTKAEPLTAEQRTLARTIVRNNETLRRSLESDTQILVEPVQRMTAESAKKFSVDTGPNASNGSDTFAIDSVDDVMVVEGERSVTIKTNQPNVTYVEDRAVVRIRNESGELIYTATVDLQNRTIIEIINRSDEQSA